MPMNSVMSMKKIMSVERNVLWRRYRILLNLFRKIKRYSEQPVVYAEASFLRF